MIVKCNCNNCSARLEFESENAGRSIPCPKCGLETKLYVPQVPPPQPKNAAPNSSAQTDPPHTSAAPKLTPAPQSSPMTYAQGRSLIAILLAGLFVFPFLKTLIETPKQWEYVIASVDDSEFHQKVDLLGSNGWELVFARRATSGEETSSRALYEMIFKREKH